MYCKYCHRPIDDSSTVCTYCGKPNQPTPKKKSSGKWFFIYTFAGLLVLALIVQYFPLVSDFFSDKSQQSNKTQNAATDEFNTLPTFTKESTESIHGSLGNSIANYSNYSCQLVECKDYIFHSYNEDLQITVIDKKADISTVLPINGLHLSIYNNTLYFVPLDGSSVFAYNLLSGDTYEPLLPQKPHDDYKYDQFFVSDMGYVFVYRYEYNTEMICVADFDGNMVSQAVLPGSTFIFINNSLLLTRQENLLITLSLPSLEQSSVAAPEGFYDYDSFGDGFIYGFYKSDDYNCIMKVDPLSGEAEMLPVDDLKGFSLSCNDNVIYYTSQSGTSAITTSGDIVGTICSIYHLFNMTFTSNEFIYCTAADKNLSFINILSELHARLKTDGSYMTTLHY